jgi:hypothetical protein
MSDDKKDMVIKFCKILTTVITFGIIYVLDFGHLLKTRLKIINKTVRFVDGIFRRHEATNAVKTYTDGPR